MRQWYDKFEYVLGIVESDNAQLAIHVEATVHVFLPVNGR